MMINGHKKIVCLVVAIFFCTFAGNAQVYSTTPSSVFSFTTGVTSSNLINDSIPYKRSILFSGGFMYSVALSERWNVATNVLYSGRAFKTESPIVKYRYYYLDIPLYLQYNAGDRIRLNVGGQFSKFTNSKIVVLDGNGMNGVNVQKYKNIKDTDYGLLVGIEADLSDDVSVALRYTTSASTFFLKDRVNFGVFQFSFCYVAFKTHRQLFHKKTVEK
jgi:Outer membrane protein beta-barrel domain